MGQTFDIPGLDADYQKFGLDRSNATTDLARCLIQAIKNWRSTTPLSRRLTITTRLLPALFDPSHDDIVFHAEFCLPRHPQLPLASNFAGKKALQKLRFCRIPNTQDYQIFAVFTQGPCEWPLHRYLDQVAWMTTRQSTQNHKYPTIIPGDMTLWWSLSGQTFRLLDLPTELRRKIFLASVGYIIQPFTKTTDKRFHSSINTALFQVSRPINEEVKDAVYMCSSFYFEEEEKLHRFFNMPFTPIMSLRHIELSFDHIDYLKFFGFELRDIRPVVNRILPAPAAQQYSASMERRAPQWNKSDALRLQGMPLTTLVVRLPHPARVRSENDDLLLVMGCQSTMVRSILGNAWPYVRGLPVILTGYIRDEEKEWFDGLVERALKYRKSWKGGLDEHWDDALQLGLPPADDGASVPERQVAVDHNGSDVVVVRDRAVRLTVNPRPQMTLGIGHGTIRARPCRCGKACSAAWLVVDAPAATGIQHRGAPAQPAPAMYAPTLPTLPAAAAPAAPLPPPKIPAPATANAPASVPPTGIPARATIPAVRRAMQAHIPIATPTSVARGFRSTAPAGGSNTSRHGSHITPQTSQSTAPTSATHTFPRSSNMP
ncbi:Hypothetical protein D9617_20g028850 [Elsinoe fawcettii]|nr:Hypothetical protein D9617_20g028850 [Elsinoe fawcettii]